MMIGRKVSRRVDLKISIVMGDPSIAARRLLSCIAAGPAQSIERIKPYIVGV